MAEENLEDIASYFANMTGLSVGGYVLAKTTNLNNNFLALLRLYLLG